MPAFLKLELPEKFVFFTALGVITGSLLLVWFVAGPEKYYQGRFDFGGYSLMADNMLKGNGFSMRESPPYLPTAFRLPGYPLLIASSKLIFGNNGLLLVLNVFMFATAALFTFRIAKILFANEHIALVAAFLMTFEIDNISSFLVYMSDNVSPVIMLISVYYLYRFLQNSRMLDFLVGLLLLSITSFIRHDHLFIVLFFGIVPVWLLWQSRIEVNKIYICTIFFLLLIIVPFGGWTLRNYKTFGVPTLVTARRATQFFYVATAVKGLGENKTQDQVRKELLSEFINTHHLRSQDIVLLEEDPTYSYWARNRSHEIFKKYPKEYHRILLISAFDFLTRAKWADPLQIYGLVSPSDIKSPPLRDILASGKLSSLSGAFRERLTCGKSCLINFGLTAMGRLFWAVISIGAALGFILFFLETKDLQLRVFASIILGIILYTAFINIYFLGPAFSSRYRMPAAPFLFMFSIYGMRATRNLFAVKLRYKL